MRRATRRGERCGSSPRARRSGVLRKPTRRSRPRRSSGRAVTVYDEGEGWAWAQLERDDYVGYLPSAALGAPSEPTHRVAALRTHAYPGPAIKLPPRMALSLGAQLTIVRREGDFAVSEDGLYLWSRSLAELSANEPDWVAVAERFLETPYLWGGRTSEGIDCSGLVQTALMAGRDRVAARQRHAGGDAGRARRHRRPERAACARRSHILEGPRRDHARSRHAASRQRLAHEDGERAAGASARSHRRQRRRRGHERSQIDRARDRRGARRATSCRRCQCRRSGC